MLAAACGDDDSGLVTTTAAATTVGGGTETTGDTTTTTSAVSSVGGGCTVEVTGDATTSWTGPNDLSAFTSDFWYTNDELREQYSLISDPTRGTFDEVMAAGGQILSFFLFNCQGPNGELVTLSLSADATRADFPFAPGIYIIRTDMFGEGELGLEEFSMILAINDTDLWGIYGEGSVIITEWDGVHLTGTFTFNAVEQLVTTPPRSLFVTGDFEITCQASAQC